jgi:hypothetical protein
LASSSNSPFGATHGLCEASIESGLEEATI